MHACMHACMDACMHADRMIDRRRCTHRHAYKHYVHDMHYNTLRCVTLPYPTPTPYTPLLHYSIHPSITLHHTTSHRIASHHIASHHITSPYYTALDYTARHYTTLHTLTHTHIYSHAHTILHCIALRFVSFDFVAAALSRVALHIHACTACIHACMHT